MTRNLGAIAAIGDPARRAKVAHEALRKIDRDRNRLIVLRRQAVSQLRLDGWTWGEVASLLGIHRNRAAHLLKP